MVKNSALTRLTEDLLPLTEPGDWTKLPGKAEQYAYNEEPSIVISRRQYDKVKNYTKPLSQRETRFFVVYTFASLAKALRYANNLTNNARLYITCNGIIRAGYDVNLAGTRDWRTVQQIVMRHSFHADDAQSTADHIFSQTFQAAVGVQK